MIIRNFSYLFFQFIRWISLFDHHISSYFFRLISFLYHQNMKRQPFLFFIHFNMVILLHIFFVFSQNIHTIFHIIKERIDYYHKIYLLIFVFWLPQSLLKTGSSVDSIFFVNHLFITSKVSKSFCSNFEPYYSSYFIFLMHSPS